jgi:hypothetical protein
MVYSIKYLCEIEKDDINISQDMRCIQGEKLKRQIK